MMNTLTTEGDEQDFGGEKGTSLENELNGLEFHFN